MFCPSLYWKRWTKSIITQTTIEINYNEIKLIETIQIFLDLKYPGNILHLILEIKSLKIKLIWAIQRFPNLNDPRNILNLILKILLAFNWAKLASI